MDPKLLAKLPEVTRGVAYTFFGDTSHDNPAVQDSFASNAFLQALQKSGIVHVAIEEPKEYQPIIDALQNGNINRDQFTQQMTLAVMKDGFIKSGDEDFIDQMKFRTGKTADLIAGARAYGIRVSGVDSVKYYHRNDPDQSKRFAHDGDVASNIELAAHGDKTAIIYGSGHIGIAPAFGDNALTINVYQSQPRQLLAENNKPYIGFDVKPAQIATFLRENRSYYTAPVSQAVDLSLGLSYMAPVVDPETRTNLIVQARNLEEAQSVHHHPISDAKEVHPSEAVSPLRLRLQDALRPLTTHR